MRIPLQVLLLSPVPACSWKFTAQSEYFTQYSNASSITTDLPNWGLSSDYSWSSLVSELQAKSNDETYYKLLFLARHGEAWHNVVKDQVGDVWSTVGTQDTYNDIILFDDDLTSTGIDQATQLGHSWKQLIESDNGAKPQSFYVSPLQRTCHTFQLTWGDSQDGVIVEDLRERYGVYTSYERHTKTWINENYPQLSFTKGFTEKDELWNADDREKKSHVQQRTHDFLKWLYKNDDNYIISITSHSGTIKQLLKEIDHPKHDLEPGQVLPVVIKAKH
ncbi:CYFA0S25e01420g1_1 [Cyberlindnera fabianii]|uniref:CYFA0S25e01420g1_1 n=1 Tax=Cyberlindnera fabianii TaxID=36022 RepID=A0A061BFR6_CYBFA|nr:CYFA0S25e01420g1_1 [Cyberlindnera fabianii]